MTIREKVQESNEMKEEIDGCRMMEMVGAPPPNMAMAAQPTPSPFSLYVTSTWGSSNRPSSLNILIVVVIVRFFVFVCSFASALSLAAHSQKNKSRIGGGSSSSFYGHSELLYFFMVTILVFIYSAYQLFKGIYDLAFSGTLISSVTSDYISFVLDQMGSYLIVSAVSVAIENVRRHPPFWKATVASIVMSWASFLMMVFCSAFSGYKLYKRIIW